MKIKVITKMACDFCSQSQDDVALLIAGPRDIAICNECVDLCVCIICREVPSVARQISTQRVGGTASPATPPPSAKPGDWLVAVGMTQPVWIETELPVRKPVHATPEASGSRFRQGC